MIDPKGERQTAGEVQQRQQKATSQNKANSSIDPEKITESIQNDGIVDWDGPDDPENPHNWSLWKKTSIIGIVSAITFITSISPKILASILTHKYQAPRFINFCARHRKSYGRLRFG